MSAITVIGLGNMGTTLARVIERAGHNLTVWNRSPARAKPFLEDGVAVAPDLASALTASPVILICIDNNPAGDALLKTDEIMPLLAGRSFIQLSTSTPSEASDSDELMKSQGALYLDGAIHCGPSQIGTTEAEILLSGNKDAYDRALPLLECLGGVLRYLGGNVRAASVLDLAAVCEAYGRFMAITHAATMCEAEGIGLDVLATMFPKDSFSQRYANVIHSSDFGNPAATLRIWEAAIQSIRTQANDSGIDPAFPDYVTNLFEKAIKAGHGDKHVMALIKVLRT